MSRNNDLKTFFVDFPELPWYYGTLKVYARTKRDAVQAARDLWARMTCKECMRLPAGTRIYTKDPAAPMWDALIAESRKTGIPVTDMY